jgi:hypothetical protein
MKVWPAVKGRNRSGDFWLQNLVSFNTSQRGEGTMGRDRAFTFALRDCQQSLDGGVPRALRTVFEERVKGQIVRR